MIHPLTIGSLFDGIGGFPLGAARNGITPVWASEIEKFPMEVTKARFPEMKHMGDITKLNGADLPPVDIICGGSPCQDLSVAGARAGLAGARSGLFMEQIRIVREMRERYGAAKPRYMVWENVPGAFSSGKPKGEDFRVVLEEICRIKSDTVSLPRPVGGTWTDAGRIVLGDVFSLCWRVLDAQYWGVPQRRRRIFLVADFAGASAEQILFERCRLRGDSAQSQGARQGAAREAGTGADTADGGITTVYDNHMRDARVTPLHDVAPTMCARYGTGGNNVPLVQREAHDTKTPLRDGDGKEPVLCIVGNVIDRQPQNGGNGLGWQEDVSYTLTAMDRHAVYSRQRSDAFKPDSVAGTQSARQYKDVTDLVCDGDIAPNQTVRRLTPLECERLQGFPDGWTNIPGASDSARYKALGNSVALPCVEFVMRGIAGVMKGEKYHA